MPAYTVTVTIEDSSSFPWNVVLVPGVYIGTLVTTGAPVCTISGGSITAFQVEIATDPSVTDPSPTITFDLVASSVDVTLVTATGVITISGSALATINADSDPDVPTPQLVFLTLDSTTIDIAAPARIAPVEGTYATGTWSFSGAAPVSLSCNNPPAGTVGVAYSHAIGVSGGTPPYDFEITAGALPPGLSIDSTTGVISGVPTTQGTFPFTVTVVDSGLLESSGVVEVFPTQLTQYFDVSANASNRPLQLIGGSLYLFLVDAVGDFTWQIFVYRSVDSGVTWTDVTPVAPLKFEASASATLGLTYYTIGSVIYIPQVFRKVDTSQWVKVYRFDTGTLSWLADSPELQIGVAGTDTFIPLQCAVRGVEIVMISSNFAASPIVDHSVLVVYDSGSNTSTSGPSNIAGLLNADVSASGVDSAGRLHFFCGTWPDQSRNTAGTFNAQHYVINADNSITGPDTIVAVTPFVVPSHDSGNAAWVSIGQPVFYEDGGVQMVAVPIRVNSTTIQIFTAVESATPIWTMAATINASAGQVFETSSASFMSVAALVAFTFNGVARVYAFWVSQAGDLWDNPGASSLSHAYLSGGVLSTPVVDYAQSAQLMPGAFYPILLGQTDTTVSLGGFFPVFNGVNFLAGFDCLTEFWLNLDLAAGSASVDCSIVISLATWPRSDGGGGGWECRVSGCIPPKENCPQWGPVSVSKANGQYWGIYRDSLGQVQQFRINPNLDAINQLAAAVIRFERGRMDTRTNNPGRLLRGEGQIAEYRGVAVFPSLEVGIEALRKAITVGLLQARREVL